MRGSVTSVTILGLLSLTAAVAAVNITRNGKVFNVFQVTKFPNDECTVSGTKVAYYYIAIVKLVTRYVQGVCLSGSECDSRGGSILGTCAAGFGSCCAIYVSDCGSDNFQFNLTYIVNPGTTTILSFV